MTMPISENYPLDLTQAVTNVLAKGIIKGDSNETHLKGGGSQSRPNPFLRLPPKFWESPTGYHHKLSDFTVGLPYKGGINCVSLSIALYGTSTKSGRQVTREAKFLRKQLRMQALLLDTPARSHDSLIRHKYQRFRRINHEVTLCQLPLKAKGELQ